VALAPAAIEAATVDEGAADDVDLVAEETRARRRNGNR